MGIVLPEADGLLVGGNGLGQPTLAVQRDAEVGVGFGEVLLQPNGLAVGGDGFLQAAFLPKGFSFCANSI